MRRKLPLLCAGSEIYGVKIPIAAADVRDASGNSGRGENFPAGVELPLHTAKPLDRRRLIDTGVLRIRAEHRSIRAKQLRAAKKSNWQCLKSHDGQSRFSVNIDSRSA